MFAWVVVYGGQCLLGSLLDDVLVAKLSSRVHRALQRGLTKAIFFTGHSH